MLHLSIVGVCSCIHWYGLSYIIGYTTVMLVFQSATPTPSLSRNGTILLELKRHYVSQRLNELQITLEHIRRCQQHGRNSKDGTRDLALTDSSSTQPGQGKHYPVHSASDGQRQDSTETSHKTDTSEGKDLGNFKYESHITELQMGNSGQTS